MGREIISRKDAINNCLPHYFTGVPCKRGHIDIRSTKYKTCYSCSRERTAEFNKRNPEKKRAWDARYAENNKEAVAEIKKRHYLKNAELIKNRVKQWAIDNKERAQQSWNAATRAYRARKRNSSGSHNRKDISKLFELQRGKCACCKSLLNAFHVDHVVPLKKCGSNDFYNLQLLCPACNARKGAKDPVSFMQENGFLI